MSQIIAGEVQSVVLYVIFLDSLQSLVYYQVTVYEPLLKQTMSLE